MEFIDHTGHVFSLPTFDDKPVALQYTESDYIFWIKDNPVSVNNYYILPIRFILDYNEYLESVNEAIISEGIEPSEALKIKISLDSQFYKLIGPKYIQNKLELNKDINAPLKFKLDDFKSELTLEDFYYDINDNSGENIIVYNGNRKFLLFPFYVIGTSKNEGTYLSNISFEITKYQKSTENIDNEDIVEVDEGTIEVYVSKTEYSQITVGCTFIDECEELIINGKNMGINLPKEILKGLYNSSFYNQYADEKLLKTKLKELLLNYMSIKGECGNFKSVINSLKWFGWGDKIEISKLIKTDNEFQDQFILDYFTIQTDLKETYKYFNSTNLISLSVKGNNETGEYNQQDFSGVLIGEGKPILEDLFDKNIEVTHDELKFYRPYYNFLFNELALKLDCLAYYWQKYFLPIHLKVNRASIEYKVYANTTKISAVGFEKIIEDPIILHTNNTKVEITNVVFPDTHELLYYKSIHYIDSKFNEFSNYNEDYNGEDLYYVNENCIYIPIKIEDINNQFVYSEYGEYLLIDGEYIKPYKIYNYNDNKLIETDNYQTAQFYKLYYNSNDYEYLQDVERYTKVTEGYFNCKIFLSYIDNETNEEKYLVKDNTFKFYQNEYQYYCNYVIIPRLIKDKSFDWLNTKFRLTIVINNKWYTYDFTVHVPNIYLDLGILNYRYYIGENTTMFKQIKSIGDNRINFNSFMYQPDLVSIDTLFYNKEQNRILTFIEKLIETEGNQNEIYDFYKKYYKNQIRIPFNRKYYNRIHIFDIYEYDEPIQILDLYEDVKASLGSINKWYVEEHYNNFFDIRLKPADFDNNLDLWMPYIVNEIITVYNAEHVLPINKISIWHGSNKSIEIYDLYVENNTLYAKSTKPKNKLKYLNNPFDITLYNQFFDSNYNFKVDFIENCEYDAYLMHDEYYENNEKPSYWYIVLISRYPISNYREQDLTIHQREYKIGNYQLKYSDYSIDKFLVNRMDVIKSNGMNHFNQDDLIVATINNNNYQFNIDLSSKWEITKCYDENESQYVNSTTNMIIIPNNNIDNLYKVGYYDIKLNYTINGLNDQQYFTQGRYRINLENQEINYPVIKEIEKEIIEIPFFTKITDFKIMFENENGDRIYTKDILDPSQGYVPVGIKIVNKGYFTEDSPAIYMGLCQLSLTNPDLGFKLAGNQNTADIPHLGFNGITINGLTEYSYICYRNENHTSTLSMIYPQHDMIDNLPKDNNGNLLYPAPNGRGFNGNPEANNSSYIDLLNMDDTYNMDLIDYTCAAFDWDGKRNTDIIISNFDEAQYPDWRTIDNLSIYNQTNKEFSPMCACAWRYHTLTTNQGDWYIPAYANVFFLSYNFKKYSDLFMQLNELYPEYCKPDLLSSIDALWTSTACNDNRYMWEIHPCRHAHILSRTTTWKSIPFINIENDES